MAGDWIKFEKATLDKPEVFEMAGILGIDPDAVVGKLLRVWDWFDDQSQDGCAPVTLAAQLNRNTGCAQFTEAMNRVGWLVIESDRLRIPNFSRHNGQSAKTRSLSAKRMAKSRGKSCGESYADTVTSSVTKTQPEKRREEKSIVTLKSNKAKGDLSDLKAFALEIGLSESDGEAAFYKWEGNGWKNGKATIKDWKATMRSWKAASYHPSQRVNQPKPRRQNEYPQEQLELP